MNLDRFGLNQHITQVIHDKLEEIKWEEQQKPIKRILAKKQVFFNLDQFENTDCSLRTFGDKEALQNRYYCLKCDVNKIHPICFECFKSCHKICNQRTTGYQETIRSGKGEKVFFTCFCGKNDKHIRANKIYDKPEICVLRYVDNSFGNNWRYTCITCNLNICSVCFVECHKQCKDKKKLRVNEAISNDCNCHHENHTEYFRDEFALVTVATEKYFKLSEIPLDYPIQYINIIFAKNFLKDLNKFVDDFFGLLSGRDRLEKMFQKGEGLPESNDPEQDYYDFLNIIFYISSIFERKFYTFYFCDSLVKLFPISRLKEMMLIEAEPKEFQNIVKLKSKFFNLLLHLHIKRDYSLMKSLTTNDFMHTSVLERLLYREQIRTKNIYTSKIHENYFIKSSDGSEDNLDDFIIWVLENIYEQVLKEQNYEEELMIVLKFLSYTLKKMIFNDIEKLTKIIGYVDKFHKTFIIKNKEFIQITYNLFCYFNKVIYLLAINYNDLMYQQGLNGNDNINYVHTSKLATTKLIEMIIKNSAIVGKHFSSCSDKVIKLFNESMRLFGITDNMYYQSMLHITELELTDYEDKMSKLHKLNGNINKSLGVIFIDNGEDMILRLKDGIEKILENYLYAGLECQSNVAVAKYDIKSAVEIKNKETNVEFLAILNEFNQKAQHKLANFQQKSERKQKEYFKTVTKKLERFRRKIITGVNTFFKYIDLNHLLTFVDTFVDELIISNIDETLSKYLYLYKDIGGEEVDAVLEFISLFFFNERGLRYIFSGKTLGRVISCLPQHPSRVLEYIYLLTKGVKIFKIDISCDKTLDTLRFEIIKYIKDSEISDTTLKFHFSNVIKILYSLSYNWEHREFEKIKQEIYEIFVEKGLFDMNIFRNTFKDNDVFFSDNQNKQQYSDVRPIIRAKAINDMSLRPTMKSKFTNILPNTNLKLTAVSKKKVAPLTSKNVNNFDDENNVLMTEENLQLKSNEEVNGGAYEIHHTLDKSVIHVESELSNRIVERKLFFSFLDLMAHHSFFKFGDKKALQPFFHFNDLEFFRHLLQETNIFLRYRTTIINYLRNFYFMELIDKESLAIDAFITTQEYLNCAFSKNADDKTLQKLKHIKDIELILSLLIHEITKLEEYINKTEHASEVDEVEAYLKSIVYSVKYIADVFYVSNISSHMTFYFYKLAKEFLIKVKGIETTLIKFVGVGQMDDKIKIEREPHKLMEDRDFNIYAKNEIYAFVLESIHKVFTKTYIYDNYKLDTFLKTYDNQVEANYQPKGLQFDRDFDVFYGYEKENEDEMSDKQALLFKLIKIYRAEFFDIYKTGLFKTTGKMSTDETEDYRTKIIEYFQQFVTDNREAADSYFITILYIITRLLYFDTRDNQNGLNSVINEEVIEEGEILPTQVSQKESKDVVKPEDIKTVIKAFISKQQTKKDFFVEFFHILRESIGITMVSAKNFFLISEYGKTFNLKTKLMVQFLQLLSEGFCSYFDKKIFLPIKCGNKTQAIYFFFMDQLAEAFKCINMNKIINGETPYDTLVVYISNIVDFLVEYIEGFSMEDGGGVLETIHAKYFELQYHNFIFHRIPLKESEPEYCVTRKKLLLYLKIQMIGLIKSLMTEINYDENSKSGRIIINRFVKDISPLALFEEVVYYLNEQITLLRLSGKINFTLGDRDILPNLIELYVEDEEFRDSLQIEFCLESYLLLKILAQKYKITIIDEFFAPLKEDPEKIDLLDKEELKLNSIFAYNTFLFLEKIIRKIEVRKLINEDEHKDIYTFFIKPPETFRLSKQTKTMFLGYDAVRDSTFTKIMSLMGSSDYFLFEMRYNAKLMETSRFISAAVKKLNFYYLEVFNYILIFIHQILLLIHYYKGNDLFGTKDEEFSFEEKYDLPYANIVLGGIQFFYLCFILLIWLVYKFPLHYNKYLMNEYYTNKSLQKGDEIQKKFSCNFDDEGNPIYLSRINLFSKVKIGFLEAILTNREVIIYMLNVILLILFYSVRNVTFLAIPVLFIANLSNILFGIILSIKLRWYQLLIVLGFTYLLCYVYAWISFYFISPSMVLENTFDPNSVINY
jgi:hypothetical protein